MTEKTIEKYLNDEFRKLGGDTYKWTSPARASVLDRICILPPGRVFFVEVKRPHALPTSAQWREIVRLKMLGCIAGYVAYKDEVDDFLAAPDMRAWMDTHVARNIDLSKLKECLAIDPDHVKS